MLKDLQEKIIINHTAKINARIRYEIVKKHIRDNVAAKSPPLGLTDAT